MTWSALPQWARLVIVAVLAVLITAPLAYCEGKGAAEAEYQAVIAEANRKALEADLRANERASEQRLTDQATLTEQARELEEVTNDETLSPADRRRAHYDCIRLQQAGKACR